MKLLFLLVLAQASPELTHYGNKWGWRGAEAVFTPQLVMYATPPHFYGKPEKVDRDIQTFLVQHGFHGFHVFVTCRWFDIDEEDCRNIPGSDPPLDSRTFEALEMLITKTTDAGGMVHLWMWGDEERGQTSSAREDWGGVDGPVARKLERAIALRLGELPGWSLGYGFDLDEWVDKDQIHAWRDRMHRMLVRHHFLGGRPGGPNHRRNHRRFQDWNRKLDYASYEHHNPTYGVYVAALEATPDKPVMSEDRFRVLDNADSKHYSLQEIRRGLWHSTLAGGVANIWGYLLEGGSHELGSAPFPNRAQLRTYFDFVEGRFLRDMERCSPRNADPQRQPLCLRSADGQHYWFYKESTSRVELGLNAMTHLQPVIAVDTRKPYAEIDVGDLDAAAHIWEAPYPSDWALAVGRFQRPPPVRRAPTPAPSPVRADASTLVSTNYPVRTLDEGDRYYSDRAYTLAVIPDLLDQAVWIQTANDEKHARRSAFITFELSRPAFVIVGFDHRASRLPHWLREWEPLPARVHVNGDVMGYFELYRRRYPAGRVTLGATSGPGVDFGDAGRSQYLIAVVRYQPE